MKKHYQSLGLKEGASQKEILEAYKRLTKELNPSNNNNQEFFKEEYKKVQEAYEALYNTSILATENGAKLNTSKSNYDLKTPNVSIENKKNKNMFTYIFNRKRNILTFVVLVFILKLVLHFFLFTETEKAVNYDKKIYVNYRTINFYTLINNSLVKNTSKKEIITSYREGLNPTTKNGQEYIFEDGVCDDCGYSLFYYPKEIHTQSFKAHLQQIFSNKPYIFLIAICILLFLVILFNDKIKAR
jgi:preprotein translocase subunit Sec63